MSPAEPGQAERDGKPGERCSHLSRHAASHAETHRGHRGRTRLGRWVKSRLRRRLFVWLGVSILLTLGVAGLVGRSLMGGKSFYQGELQRVSSFASGQFQRVWSKPTERRELAQAVARDLKVSVVLRAVDGELLEGVGECAKPDLVVPVFQPSQSGDGALLGTAAFCLARPRSHGAGWSFFLALFAAGGVLWLASGWFARRMTRPLERLVQTAREIGEGQLASRTQLSAREAGEVGVLAEAIDHMAGRIQRQMHEHKELLAAVSHEVRTPLARLRVLVELLRTAPESEALLADVEQEVLEIDRLMSELIASSRLDFEQLDLRELPVGELAARALERAGLSAELLDDHSAGALSRVDPTLIARALANLLENARRHAGAVERVELEVLGERVQIRVVDAGPGFPEAELERAFQAFHRRRGGGLGLGLALVRRIAEAHGGRAWAENRPEAARREAQRPEPSTGARVCMELPAVARWR